MSSFRYKTRGNSSAQGKAKVYFTCHEADFVAFFDTISEDILKLQNCAIWYLDESGDTKADIEYPDFLNEMHLIVIPVTRRFLFSQNRARCTELPYALSHHKPVLPILMEDGLEASFNEICGDLQIVSRKNADSTAKSYETRLKEYLQTVLVGDELADRIRASFDAYIFLSYRKKDRADAQKLMRIIHSHDFCRSIAIWYDEFLVPGENFTDAILDAMKKSSLFALVVTPNLINENNYVMSTEYPEATERNMLVLPFEMRSTDPELLSDKFKDIGHCINPENAVELARELKDAIQTIALSSCKKDPIHRFFLGLAYLEGIDVEIDAQLALQYIEGAADDGLPEAVKHLADMYRTGNGVKRDMSRSIEHHRQYARLLKQEYEKGHSDEKAKCYLSALSEIGLFLKEARRLEEAHTVYEEICEFCVPLQQVKNWAAGMLMLAYDERAQIFRMQNNPDMAFNYLNKNLNVMERIHNSYPDDSSIIRMMAVTYNNLGRTYLVNGKYPSAEDSLRHALEIFERIENKQGDCASRRDVSATCGYLGNVYFVMSENDRAMKCFSRMLEINKDLMQELDTNEAKRDYAISLSKVALTNAAMGNYSDAAEYENESLKIFEELYEKVGTFEAVNDLFNTYDYLFMIYGNLQNPGMLYRIAAHSMEIADNLERIHPCTESKIALRKANVSWAELMSFEGNHPAAAQHMQKAIDAGLLVVKAAPSEENMHALASAYYNFGIISADRNAFRAAYETWSVLEKRSGNQGRFTQFMDMALLNF